MDNLIIKLKKTKQASVKLAGLPSAARNKLLGDIAAAILKNGKKILVANQKDLKAFGGEQSMRDRLELNPKKITGIVKTIVDVIKLPDPLNQVLEVRRRPNGLKITKISVPLGVVGVIYESRPNVTADLAVLALRPATLLF